MQRDFSIFVPLSDYLRFNEQSGINRRTTDKIQVQCKVDEVTIEGELHVKYRNLSAVQYAQKWCGVKNNSCGYYFQGEKRSDCAHFLSHCLQAGGIQIKRIEGPDGCNDDLSVRVAEIKKALECLSEKYKNVYPIDYDEGIYGDPAYLNTFSMASHAVLVKETKPIAGKPRERETLYYAHSNERCGSSGDLRWYQSFGGAFRIYDAK